jgi:hypothetical protein
MERAMTKGEESRMIRRIAEDIDDALEFNLPFIAGNESDVWRQVHELLRLIGRFAEDGSAPEPLWRDCQVVLCEVHKALLAAVSRGRAPDMPEPARPAR